MQLEGTRRSQLEELKKECAAIESNIQSLEVKLEDKRRKMALLSPIYTLPDDVACEILKVAYSHHFPHCRLDDGLPHTHSPVAISHVSRWWRAQALSVPSIWTCIHVTPQQPAHYAEVIKAYIVRSRELPLSISFICMSEYKLQAFPAIDEDDFTPWNLFQRDSWPRFRSSWKYLVTEKHRWRNVALHITYIEAITAIMKESYKQSRHDDDLNQPLSVHPWGKDGLKRRYWLVEGRDDTPFRLIREDNTRIPCTLR